MHQLSLAFPMKKPRPRPKVYHHKGWQNPHSKNGCPTGPFPTQLPEYQVAVSTIIIDGSPPGSLTSCLGWTKTHLWPVSCPASTLGFILQSRVLRSTGPKDRGTGPCSTCVFSSRRLKSLRILQHPSLGQKNLKPVTFGQLEIKVVSIT